MEDIIVRFLLDPWKFILSPIRSGNLPGEAGFFSNIWQVIWGIFVFLDVILLVTFISVFFISLKYRPKLHPKHGAIKRVFTVRDAVFKERWQKIQEKIATGSPDSLKVAIIDADKLADDVLKQSGLEGEHMADRLEKLFPQELRTLDKLWRAHRLRNNLVHNPGFEIDAREAKTALRNYEAFLKEVKALE